MARKQKTAAQKAKAKATIKKRVEESRKATVEQIIKLMEQGGLSWVKDWNVDGFTITDAMVPHNPITGTVYRGMNRMKLASYTMAYGLDDNRFCTEYQARKMGWKVSDNAHPLVVEKWKVARWKETDADGNETFHAVPRCVSFFYVYNFSEIDGTPEMPTDEGIKVRDREKLDDMLDALKETSRCEIRERVDDRAYYSVGLDFVSVPHRDEFTTLQGALRTLLHEMGHSTSHPDAVGRTIGGKFGSSDYAFEELIAELCSVFTASYLNVDIEPEEEDKHKKNHAAYLQSWLKSLNDNPDYLYRAAAKAADASDYIIEKLLATHPEYTRTFETIEVSDETANAA